MKLLIAFLLALFVLSALGAHRAEARPRPLLVFAGCTVVSLAYLARRFL